MSSKENQILIYTIEAMLEDAKLTISPAMAAYFEKVNIDEE